MGRPTHGEDYDLIGYDQLSYHHFHPCRSVLMKMSQIAIVYLKQFVAGCTGAQRANSFAAVCERDGLCEQTVSVLVNKPMTTGQQKAGAHGTPASGTEAERVRPAGRPANASAERRRGSFPGPDDRPEFQSRRVPPRRRFRAPRALSHRHGGWQ